MKRAPAARRLAILDAAAHAIARHGFHGMSMRALAAATGQSLGAFYNHFPSKEEVLLRIQADAFEAMIASAAEALRGIGSPPDRLFAFIDQHVRFVAAHRDVMRVLVEEAGALPPRGRARVRRLKERYYGLAREIVGRIVRQGGAGVGERDLERQTYGVFGMLNWVYGWYEKARHGSPAEVAAALHRLAMGGLSSPAPAVRLSRVAR